MKISGAQLIVSLLERHGVRLVAGIPGGAVLPLYDALGRSRSIRHVLARHEQGAGFIAQGIARVSGRAGVCLVTSGPGVTNVVTALADAKLDSVPLVCISGQVPTHLIGSDAFQEVATLDMVRPIVKDCWFAEHARELPRILAAAFHTAQNGRPGPVLIDIPKDVQTQVIDLDDAAMDYPDPPTTLWGEPSSIWPETSGHLRHDASRTRAYDTAVALIEAAKRPVLYVGGGVTKARAHTLARELAERMQLPMTTTLMALGVLPHTHELHLGMLGMHGAHYTNLAIDEADLLIAIGARFDDRATGDPAAFAARARIIHIDIDAREFGKIKTPTLAIQDDAATALGELLTRSGARPVEESARAIWRQRIASLRDAHPLRMPNAQDLCSPYGIMRALGALLPPNAVITTDVGQHQMWAAQALSIPRADRWLTSGGLGTMGFGLPAAIGAALAAEIDGEDHLVACITGDGSFMMNPQELATLAELGLNVKIILLDNAALGMVRQQQTLFYGARHTASNFRAATDFVKLTAAFGIAVYDLGLEEDRTRSLRRAIMDDGPALIRVPIAQAEQVMPMVAPGAANTRPLLDATSSSRPLLDHA